MSSFILPTQENTHKHPKHIKNILKKKNVQEWHYDLVMFTTFKMDMFLP